MKIKLLAFFKHFLISFFILGSVTFISTYHFYPDFFFLHDGGLSIITITLLIDLFLGPLLVSIVYNEKKNKKELKRDIYIIFLLQLISCFYGLNIMYQQRPQYLVLTYDSMTVLTKNYILDQKYNNTFPYVIENKIFKLKTNSINEIKEKMLKDKNSFFKIENYETISIKHYDKIKRFSINQKKLPKDLLDKYKYEDYIFINTELRNSIGILVFNKSLEIKDFYKIKSR